MYLILVVWYVNDCVWPRCKTLPNKFHVNKICTYVKSLSTKVNDDDDDDDNKGTVKLSLCLTN
jgi:hypothetical protein